MRVVTQKVEIESSSGTWGSTGSGSSSSWSTVGIGGLFEKVDWSVGVGIFSTSGSWGGYSGGTGRGGTGRGGRRSGAWSWSIAIEVRWNPLHEMSAQPCLLEKRQHTVMRYSTARSGLLNAARIARSICGRSNPMSIICWTAAERVSPKAKADGSLKLVACGISAAGVVLDPAGVGVSGTAGVEREEALAACGADGVWITGVVDLAGVEGAANEEEEAAAGTGLGWDKISACPLRSTTMTPGANIVIRRSYMFDNVVTMTMKNVLLRSCRLRNPSLRYCSAQQSPCLVGFCLSGSS